jgi:hypothetical protein
MQHVLTVRLSCLCDEISSSSFPSNPGAARPVYLPLSAKSFPGVSAESARTARSASASSIRKASLGGEIVRRAQRMGLAECQKHAWEKIMTDVKK